MEFNNFREMDKHQVKWPEIIIMFMTIISFLWSLRKESVWWVLIPIALFVLCVVLLIRDSGLFNRLVNRHRLRKQYKRGDRETKKHYSRFVLLIEKSGLFRNLMDHLDRTEWANKDNYPQLGNIRFVNWHNRILETAKGLKIKHLDEMNLIVQRFRDFLEAFNEHYIQTFSTAYKLGHAKYPSEDFKKQIVQLKRQYDNVLGEYNDFCKEFNNKCSNSILAPIYSFPPDLDWVKGDKP
jgi:hypothetical protein